MTHFTRRRFLAAASAAPAFGSLLQAAASKGIPLGVTTDEIDDDVATAAKYLQDNRLHWAEIRNIWGKYNTVQPMEKVHEATSILKSHQVKVNVLGTGFFKIPLPMEDSKGRGVLDNQWSLLDSAFERAKAMGTDKIRVFAFTYKDGETPDTKVYPRIYELVTEAARRAKARGFRLALENVGQSYVWTGAQAADLLKNVKHESLGLTWDPNNAATAGEKSFPDGYKLLDPARIFHVHLRDFRKAASGKVEWCAVGEGEMDNVGQLKAMAKAGYKGSYTLETHWKSPQGKTHATTASLAGLRKVFEQLS